MAKTRILIVDDDDSVTASLGLLLKQEGYEPVQASSPDQAMERLADGRIAAVLQDMNFSLRTSGEEGLDLLARIRRLRPNLPVLLMTAWGSIELAVAGMKAGAADFITKPWSRAQILQSVRTALGLSASRCSGPSPERLGRSELDERWDFAGIVGDDPSLLEVLALLGRVSDTDASVLVTGESGTGKEVVAEAIHRNSHRRSNPFIKVNMAGIPATLFESEMFGHVRGAFTDAHRDRQGRFAVADGGTILLDEIGELDVRSQVKLLRVLQDRTYEVLGSSETRVLDVRVISSTNRDLERAVEEGLFREDLLYRLNLIAVHLPRLADRRDDIPLLAAHFLSTARTTYGGSTTAISDAAVAWLKAQDWPGNIRQLKHLVERAVLVSGAAVLEPEHLEHTSAMDRGGDGHPRHGSAEDTDLDSMEKSAIERAIGLNGGNLTRAAKALGLSRAALYRRIAKHGIKV